MSHTDPDKIHQLMEKNMGLMEKLLAAQTDNSAQALKMKDMTHTIAGLQTEIAQLRHKLSSRTSRLHSVPPPPTPTPSSDASTQPSTDRLSVLTSELDRMKAEVDRLSAANTSLTSENETLSAENKELLEYQTKTQAVTVEVQTLRKALVDQMTALAQSKSEMDALTAANKALKEDNEDLEDGQARLHTRVKQRIDEEKVYKAKAEERDAEIETLRKTVSDQAEAMAQLKPEIETLQQTVSSQTELETRLTATVTQFKDACGMVHRGTVTRSPHITQVMSIATSASDNSIAVGYYDGKVCVYSATGALKYTADHGDAQVCAVVFLPDGTLVSAGTDNRIKSWADTATLSGHSSYVWCLAAFPDGRLVSGSNDCTIRVWNGRDCVATLTGHTHGVYAVVVFPDGRLASGSADRTIRIWGADLSYQYSLTGHIGRVYALAVLSDGRLVSGSSDRTIKVWDGKECVSTLTGHTGEVWSLCVLPSGVLASGSHAGEIKLWVDGMCVSTLSHTTYVRLACLSSTGTLVSGTQLGEHSVKLWSSAVSSAGAGTGASAGAGRA